jgi:hypothetical protein
MNTFGEEAPADYDIEVDTGAGIGMAAECGRVESAGGVSTAIGIGDGSNGCGGGRGCATSEEISPSSSRNRDSMAPHSIAILRLTGFLKQSCETHRDARD